MDTSELQQQLRRKVKDRHVRLSARFEDLRHQNEQSPVVKKQLDFQEFEQVTERDDGEEEVARSGRSELETIESNDYTLDSRDPGFQSDGLIGSEHGVETTGSHHASNSNVEVVHGMEQSELTDLSDWSEDQPLGKMSPVKVSFQRKELDDWVLREPMHHFSPATPLFQANYITSRSPLKQVLGSSESYTRNAESLEQLAREESQLGGLAVEILAKLYLEFKVQLLNWLDLFGITIDSGPQGEYEVSETESRDGIPPLDAFHSTLKSGICLCAIANKLWKTIIVTDVADEKTVLDSKPCIPTVNKVLSGKVLRKPLLERENIQRFLTAVKEFFQVPAHLVFKTNDLYNKQNMIFVLLTLKAVAKHAELQHVAASSSKLHPWPTIQLFSLETRNGTIVGAEQVPQRSLEEDAKHCRYTTEDLERCKTEMMETLSKSFVREENFIDVFVEIITSSFSFDKEQALPASNASPEDLSFPEKQEGLLPVARTNLRRLTLTAKAFLQSRQRSRSFSGPSRLPNRYRRYHAFFQHRRFHNLSAEERVQGVMIWLKSVSLENYIHLFVENGWDDLETVAMMEEEDLVQIGLTKRGHLKRLVSSIKEMNRFLSLWQPESSHHPLQLLYPQVAASHISAQEKQRRWRAENGYPMDATDARMLWTMVRELKVKLNKISTTIVGTGDRDGNHRVFKDWVRAFEILTTGVETGVKELLPFDTPIIVDLGFHTIKVQYAFAKAPILIPSIVAYTEGRSSVRSVGVDVNFGLPEFLLKRPMYKAFQNMLDPHLVSFEDIQLLLRHALNDVLQVGSRNHPVFFTYSQLFQQSNHIKVMVELLFNKLNLSHVFLSASSVLIAEHMGIKTGFFLDIGETRCTCVFVTEGAEMTESIAHMPIGMQDVALYLLRRLQRMFHQYHITSVLRAGRKDGLFTKVALLEQIFAGYLLQEFGKVASHKQLAAKLEVSETQSGEHLLRSRLQRSDYADLLEMAFTQICGYDCEVMELSYTAMLACESLFSPELIQGSDFYDTGGLSHLVFECCKRVPERFRTGLGTDPIRLVLHGGGAGLQGVGKRLELELREMPVETGAWLPEVEILVPEQPQQVSWQAAKAVVSSKAFQPNWIAKTDIMRQKALDGKEASPASLASSNEVDMKKLNKLLFEMKLFPLKDPEKDMLFTNKSLAAMHYLTSSFYKEQVRRQKETDSRANSPLNAEARSAVVKDNLNRIVQVLRQKKVSEVHILKIQVFISEQYLISTQRTDLKTHDLSVISLVHSLPSSLKKKIQPYLGDLLQC